MEMLEPLTAVKMLSCWESAAEGANRPKMDVNRMGDDGTCVMCVHVHVHVYDICVACV